VAVVIVELVVLIGIDELAVLVGGNRLQSLSVLMSWQGLLISLVGWQGLL
jgi:hypothetical protein